MNKTMLTQEEIDQLVAAQKDAPPGPDPTEAPVEPESTRREFEEFDRQSQPEEGHAEPSPIDLVLDIPVEVTVELGRTKRLVREVLAMVPGSIIELDRQAGEPVDVLVNGRLIARGEVVVIDENFGIRVSEIVSRPERLANMR